MYKIYTIGSSIHTADEFISLLKKYNINAIADVRSVPYSKHTPQYNKEALINILKKESINYLDFSKEFGARREENCVYTNNKVDFKKVMQLPEFNNGINRINNGILKGYEIALLCTEKNPLDCHRFSLVSRALFDKLNTDIEHILFNGDTISQQVLEKKMLDDYGYENDLFMDYKTQLENAYEKLNNLIAYQEQDNHNE